MQRRDFLATLAATGLGGNALFNSQLMNHALAAEGTFESDYKALVCVFMVGGMDHNDTILPYDEAEYAQMRSVRTGLFDAYSALGGTYSRDRSALLPIDPINNEAVEGRRFAVPQQLSGLKDMFDDEELCFVGSVGSLIEPTTRTTYANKSVQLPPSLFSHNDQRNYWQGLATEGAKAGWGGRFIDALGASGQIGDSSRFASISTAGNNLFASGNKTSVFQIGSKKMPTLNVEDNKSLLGNNAHMDQVRARLFNYFRDNRADHANLLASDYHQLQSDALLAGDQFRDQFNSAAEFQTSFPSNFYGPQFQNVAKSIRVAKAFGLRRQIYFIAAGGFDTHATQSENLPWRQASLSDSLRAFSTAMKEVGLWNNVTVFSAADFGRTLVSNESGTDHGWGSHHFIAGGRVKGKRIVGKMPRYNPDGEEYTKSRARLIPTVPIEQYSATLGKWMGVTDASIDMTLPNLNNFSTRTLDVFNS